MQSVPNNKIIVSMCKVNLHSPTPQKNYVCCTGQHDLFVRNDVLASSFKCKIHVFLAVEFWYIHDHGVRYIHALLFFNRVECQDHSLLEDPIKGKAYSFHIWPVCVFIESDIINF